MTGDRAFVVGVAGLPGAGKTTLTDLLRRDHPQAQAVYYDEFQTITRMAPPELRAWFARGADPNEFSLSELVAELTRRIQAPPRSLVLFETPFGRLHRASGAFIDFLVWVDTPLDAALARALLAIVGTFQRDNVPNAAPGFVAWMKQYLENYEMVRKIYVAQREAILPTADLIVDGGEPAEAVAERVRKALADKLSAR